MILIVCGKIFSFSCKMLMWQVRIGGCKLEVLHSIYIEFNLYIISIKENIMCQDFNKIFNYVVRPIIHVRGLYIYL